MNQEDCLFEIAASQGGHFTTAQARACGYSWALLSHHAANGRFVRARRGLYRLRQYPSSPREEVMAAWLAAGSDAVASHESALDLLGLADIIPDSIHLTIPRAKRGRRPAPGVTLHTALQPPTDKEVVTRDGIRITSPARTILDAAQSGVAPDQVTQAVRQALDRGLATRGQLLAAARDRGGRVEQLIANALEAART
jgi:predicted transcriptional regulator of viral defense system